MVTEEKAGDENRMLRYKIRVLIKHPNIDPARITGVLGLNPSVTATAGGARKTPTGRLLPGVHKVSAWTHSYTVRGHRHFFSRIEETITKLESHKAFLAEISDGDGVIYLIVDLLGKTNIGDVLSWQAMMRLSALHINLSIEVFPDS